MLPHAFSGRVSLNTKVRCLALEKIAAVTVFPCRYADKGCEHAATDDKLFLHEFACPFMPLRCVDPSCG